MIGLLRQKARPYLFSNTLAPCVAAASITVFDLLTRSHELRDKLQDNTDYFRQHMAAAGFDIRPGNHPIVVSTGTRPACKAKGCQGGLPEGRGSERSRGLYGGVECVPCVRLPT